ncbi:MAG: hypothetical protein AAB784_02975 [Patescibacteria group bacterium]
MENAFPKKYWFIVGGIVVACVFIFYIKLDLPKNVTGASLGIHFEDGQIRKFEGSVESNMTILEALYSASVVGDFEVKYFLDKDGKTNLLSIDDLINGPDKNWQAYLNDVLISTYDLNKTKLRPGDNIVIKYE